MKFALVHLSGRHRGETHYFDRQWLSLGSDPLNDLVFPADGSHPVAAVHAELFQTDCDLHLRNRDVEGETLVNHKPVMEVRLHDKDLIQLGPKGPKLRFRIRPDEYAACKLAKEILQDARDIAAEAMKDGRGKGWSFVGQLLYEIRHHASRTANAIMLGLLVVLIGVVGLTLYSSYTTRQAHERRVAALVQQLEAARLTQADIERRMADERRRMGEALRAHQVEIDRLTAMLEEEGRRGASPEELRALTGRLKALEAEHTSAELLIKRYGPSVCFLYIAYGFLEKGRAESVPSAVVEYMGTGFLMDHKGLMVTNRHITEPWYMDPTGTEMIKAGLEPKLMTLLAYFHAHREPYEVSLVRLSDRADVALGRLAPVPKGIAPIPIRKPAPAGVMGEAVVLLGYPAAVEGILARMDDKVTQQLMKRPGRDLRRLVQDIADLAGSAHSRRKVISGTSCRAALCMMLKPPGAAVAAPSSTAGER